MQIQIYKEAKVVLDTLACDLLRNFTETLVLNAGANKCLLTNIWLRFKTIVCYDCSYCTKKFFYF